MVNTLDNDGVTALHLAAANGHLDSVALLVKRGADTEAKSKEAWTPLVCAVNRGRIDCAAHLLDHGANVDHRTRDGRTALHRACENGDHEAVQLLLYYNPKVGGVSSPPNLGPPGGQKWPNGRPQTLGSSVGGFLAGDF
jgi:ankyrin repeat protein